MAETARARSHPPAENARTSSGRLLADRIARLTVTAGGVIIIACILGILFFLVGEVVPLLAPARVAIGNVSRVAGAPLGGIIVAERRDEAASLALDGTVRVLDASDGRVLLEKRVAPALVASARSSDGHSLAGSTDDGDIVLVRVQFTAPAEGGGRSSPAIADPIRISVDPGRRPIEVFTAASDGDESVAAGQLADGTLAIVRTTVEENSITGERSASLSRFTAPSPGPLTALLVDGNGRNLYGGTANGRLFWWRLDGSGPVLGAAHEAGAKITALALLAGHRSLVVGQEDGGLSVWFQVPRAEKRELQKIRSFPPRPAPIRSIASSPRGRVFLALDGNGGLELVASTAEQVQWTGAAGIPGASLVSFAPRGDGAFISAEGAFSTVEIRNPHSEISLKALFGKIWYEGYEKPAFVWQSSGGTDDFEPKLSLVPLLAGTLKGTFYSLSLAVPLGILGAIYASQFTGAQVKRIVKPVVEIMAALPSVVLGFIAGLWLAPRIERVFPALILMVVVLPGFAVLAHFFWRALPRRATSRLTEGSELAVFILALAVGGAVCVALAEPFQSVAFGGSFPTWVREAMGLPFDQRNAVVVGIAMGFAVIPIIFSITEDALTNVPRHLASASLALGATKWQTVTRVVLPAASPGIFAAVMVGFGRAVGETMIVVMATGNTPILGWNPFDGFRTLSANIAVEIPEAAQGATLYRTLFVSALLLFALTFAVNSVAEIVRQRLRRRYAVL